VEYGKIIKRAWNIIWQHKVLWIFGIAAVLFGAEGGRGGGMPGMQYNLDKQDMERWRRGMMPWGSDGPLFRGWGGLPPVEEWLPVLVAIAGLLFVVAVVLFVISVIVRYTSVGALIGGVNDVEQSDETTFRGSLRQGWKRLLRLFATDLIIGLATGIVAIAVLIVFLVLGGVLIGLPVALLVNAANAPNWLAIVWGVGVGLILLLLLIVLMVIVSALSTLVREFAFRASVIDQRGVFDSLRDGVALVRGRFRDAGLMWLLLVAIDLALTLLSLPVLLLGAGMIAVPTIVAARAAESPAALLVAVPLILLLGLIVLFVAGVYYAFRSSVWTLTYRELKSVPLLVES